MTDPAVRGQRRSAMVGPLLESKYRVPGRRLVTVARPRLTDALDAARNSASTVLSAPAGFGKTTLLTEWLAGVPADAAAVAWLAGPAGQRARGLLVLRRDRDHVNPRPRLNDVRSAALNGSQTG